MRQATPAVFCVDLKFRALSDRTRLRILYLLLEGEMCVCDIMDILRIAQPSVSRHLAYLRRSGMVSVRRSRTWSYYSLAPAEGPLHEKLLDCLRACFDEVPEIRADAARAKRTKRAGSSSPQESASGVKPAKKTEVCCPDDERSPGNVRDR